MRRDSGGRVRTHTPVDAIEMELSYEDTRARMPRGCARLSRRDYDKLKDGLRRYSAEGGVDHIVTGAEARMTGRPLDVYVHRGNFINLYGPTRKKNVANRTDGMLIISGDGALDNGSTSRLVSKLLHKEIVTRGTLE